MVVIDELVLLEMSGREVRGECHMLIWPSSVSLDGLADEPNLKMQKAAHGPGCPLFYRLVGVAGVPRGILATKSSQQQF